MFSLKQDERKAFEDYLTADGDPALQQKAIDGLVKGSLHHDYLSLLDKVKRIQTADELSQQERALIEKMIDQLERGRISGEDYNLVDQLRFKYALLRFDAAEKNQDKQQRDEVLSLMNKHYLNISFDHQKPVKEGHKNDDSLSSQEEDKSKDTLDHDLFSTQRHRNDFERQLKIIQKKIEEASEKVAKSKASKEQEYQVRDAVEEYKRNCRELGNYFNQFAHLFEQSDAYQTAFDYTKYEPFSVFLYACQLATTQSKWMLSQMRNESFFTQVIAYSNEFAKERDAEAEHAELKHIPKDFWDQHGSKLLDALTLNQMDKLKSMNKDFFGSDEQFCAAYFKKQFGEELSQETQSLWTVEEKLAVLRRLEEYTRTQNLPKMLKMEFRNEILALGPEIGQYDEELFIQYLEDNDKTVSIFKDYTRNSENQMKKRANIQRSKVQQYINSYKPLLETQTPLVMKYLRHFCIAEKGSLKKFEKYFDKHVLNPIEQEVRILQAKDGLASLKDFDISLDLFRSVADRVVLEFTESNKKVFQVDEEVTLEVNLKNIQQLYVRVFEFNTETYYKKNLTKFDTNVNLDGLEARIKEVREYSHPSNIQFTDKFTIEHLKGKIGIFIIEMMGNGMSARAVVKKGSLSLVHRSTIAGQQLFILDDQKRICKGEDCRTGVIIDGKFYGASKEKGRIDIPFAKSAHSTQIILIRDHFAEIQDFQRETEQFEFAAAFYLNQESMLVGSSTSILIRPKLLINGSKANLKMLKNCKAVLRITNYIDDIPVTKNFDQLSFTNEREVAVQFQVPPNLGSINIRLTAQVLNSTTRKMQDFAVDSSFEIISMISNSNVADAYLRREKGLYNAYFLGRNGEPFSKQEVDVTLRHILHKDEINTKLVTNKEGALHLGKLAGVPSIRLSMPAHRVNARWTLTAQETKHNAQYVHPGHITLLEGESLVLPISLPDGVTSPSRDLVTLVRSLNESVIDDCFASLKIELIGDPESGYHQLRADNMQQGKYYLSIMSGYARKLISLEVKKGQYWQESDGFILMKDRLQTSQDAAKILQISSVKLAAGQQGKHSVTVDIENATKQVRVHAIATTFVQNDGGQLASKLNEMLQWSEFSQQFLFRNQESIFMSNKKMSDEIRYVFERKQLEGKLGNTLERPTLLIKKNFIKETSIDSENLALGDQLDGKAFGAHNAMMRNALQRHAGPISHLNGGRFTESSELINFLKNAPIQQFNLAPEVQDDAEDSRQKRTITFDLGLCNYSQLYLVAVDRDSLVQRNIDLDLDASVSKRDMRLNKVLDDQKGITETRKTVKLAPKVSELIDQQFPSSDFIEDITSSEVQLVDSISKVVEILEEIQKMNGISNQQQDWDKFSFVKSWATLSPNDKDRYYSEYLCHELNLYLRRRDPEYFDAVVKPFLQYKLEKKFIDHYLLSNYKKCNKYVDFQLYQSLNALEICLLVDSLVKSGKIDQAQCIVNALNLQMESINAATTEKVTLNNKIFDLVLNLNTLNDVKGDLAKLQDKARLEEEKFRLPSESQGQRPGGQMRTMQFSQLERGMVLDDLREKADQLMDESISFASIAPQADRFRSLTRSYAPPKAMMKRKEMKKESIFEDDDEAGGELFSQRQVAMRKQDFEEVEQTSEFMETHYYKQTNLENTKSLIPMTQFWADYANYLLAPVGKRGSFISDNFVDCSVSKQQVFLIQVVLDLPLVPTSNHRFEPDEQRGVTVHAASNLLLYKKFIAEANLDLRRDVKVIHRYQQLSGANESEQLSGRPNPFLSSTPYKCEVVLTNVSPKTKAFSLLYQIPQGAMPMLKSKYMKSHYMSLSPYTTQKVTFEFYFPAPGKYTHFPSNISVDQIVQARGDSNILVVEKSRRITQIESFVDLLLTGTKADVLNFLETEDLIGSDKKFSFYDMLYLLKDEDFFNKAINILAKRKYFNDQVWSYAFFHSNSTRAMREYLQFRDQELSNRVGTHFSSQLLSISDQNSSLGFTKHLEYHPMVNRRAHKVGGEASNRILNREFRQTYDSFLTTLAQKRELSEADKLCFVYFLQLQDREQEACKVFRTIKEPQDGELRVQYDYLQAYLEFFNRDEKDFLKARAIVRKYDQFPITQWRMMFLAIEDQLNEIDGEFDDEELEPIDEESKDFDTKIAEKRKENKKVSQKRESNLNSVEVDTNGTLKVETVNIRELTVKYYNINAELMFTRAPFIKDNTEAFTYVMPFFTERKQMVPSDADDSQMNAIVTAEIPMPPKLKNLNLVIEINGGEKQQFKTFYSNQLKITTLESYGELKVAHAVTGKALPKVYVKVFGLHKSTNKEFFFRDGYTDIRGKIEYAQTSGDKLRNVKKFAILVVSDEFGSKILECDPPKTDFGPEQPIVLQSQAEAFKPTSYAYGNESSKMNRLINRQNYVQSKKCK